MVRQFEKVFGEFESALAIEGAHRDRRFLHHALAGLQPDRAVRLGRRVDRSEKELRVVQEQRLKILPREGCTKPPSRLAESRVYEFSGLGQRVEEMLLRERR